MADLLRQKNRMIDVHLRRRGIIDKAVLRAMQEVPRERFVEPGLEAFAYDDTPLSIGEGQTISQPYIVALMVQAAEISHDDIVLEVGTGSGYAAAVMSRIARKVFTIEWRSSLALAAQQRLDALGYSNITTRLGDGTEGWPEAGPFNAIIVAAAASEVPKSLLDQLDIGGRMVLPLGNSHRQRLLKITRRSATTFDEEDLGRVVFVPLICDRHER